MGRGDWQREFRSVWDELLFRKPAQKGNYGTRKENSRSFEISRCCTLEYAVSSTMICSVTYSLHIGGCKKVLVPARREISNSKRIVGILKHDGRVTSFFSASQYAVRFVSVLACLKCWGDTPENRKTDI